jgi:LPS-assembly protein
VLDQVLHLRGEVERELRVLPVEGARDRESMARAVEKIGVDEVDVLSARVYELPHVGEDGVLGDDEEPTSVHRRDRTVTAEVETTAGALDRSHSLAPAVGKSELRVAGERRERPAGGDGEIEALENGSRSTRVPSPVAERRDSFRERPFELAAQDRVHSRREQQLRVQGRVEAVEAQVRERVQRAEPGDDLEGDAESGMHRDRNPDEIRCPHPRFVERLDREIEGVGVDSGALQEREGRREAQGLPAELVARQKQSSGPPGLHPSFMTIFIEKVQNDRSCIIPETMPGGPFGGGGVYEVVLVLEVLMAFRASPLRAQSAPAEETTLKAATQEQVEKGHVKAEGYVDIHSGDVHLTADRVEFWNEEMRVIAEGNVVYEQGDQKIIATRLEADLRTKTGRFFNAHGRTGADLYFYGDVLEKISEDTYVVEGGVFTSCAQPVPRWNFTSGRATIRRDHHVALHNPFLKVKSIPVFYAPYLYYPINEQGRSTGLLLPRIGNSSLKGFLFNQGFFWAINRSMDATFAYERFSLVGNGGTVEYRYVTSQASRGQVSTFFVNDSTNNTREYTVNGSVNQELPGGFRSIARVDYFSTFDFQQRFQESYDRATQRSKRASGTISKAFGQYNLRVLFDRNDTSFGENIAVRKVLPQVTFGSRASRLGPTPVLFSFDSEASSLGRSIGAQVFEYSRFDVAPTLSYPFTGLSYLTMRASVTGRYTHYGSSQTASGAIADEPVDRHYVETAVDVRGPTFAKIFNTPGNFYAIRYKHVIEPQIVWSYRTRVDQFDSIPKFDGNDYIPGTNQVAFSLVNRVLAKRVVNGKEQSTPAQMLTWTLSQRYFFQTNASLYDPQFSTPYYTAEGIPSSYSPITSRVNFRPSRTLSATWNLDYDLNFHAVRSASTTGNFSGDWGSLSGVWTRRNIPGRTAAIPDIVRSSFRVGGSVNIGAGLQAHADASYDWSLKILRNFRAGVVYNVQCCGFLFDYNRFNFGNFRDENTFRFGITLANVGSFGTSLGGPQGTAY